MTRAFLRGLLVEESFAYGFTIAFWGSGLLLVNAYGLLETRAIVAYAVGAITGFGLLAVVAFGAAVETVDADQTPSYHVLAAVHYLAALVPIALTHVLIAASLGRSATLVLTGMTVSIGYNVFAGLEEAISEVVFRLEEGTWVGGLLGRVEE